MKEEIKEILEYLEGIDETRNTKILTTTETYILLDYITNLQEENTIKDTNWESLKYYLEKLYYRDYIEEPIFDDIDKKIKELESKVEIKGYQKEIKQLQEENERLKELCDKYEEEHSTAFNLWKTNIIENVPALSDMQEQYEDYKQRNEKAIEYIDKHTIEWKDDKFEEHNIMVKFNEYSNPQALKDILKGDKDE